MLVERPPGGSGLPGQRDSLGPSITYPSLRKRHVPVHPRTARFVNQVPDRV